MQQKEEGEEGGEGGMGQRMMGYILIIKINACHEKPSTFLRCPSSSSALLKLDLEQSVIPERAGE